MPACVLVLDPRPSELVRALAADGFEPSAAPSLAEALRTAGEREPELALLGASLDEEEAGAALLGLLALPAAPAVVVLSARGSVARAVEALRCGAADYLEWPCDGAAVAGALARALEARRARRAEPPRERPELAGRSPLFRRALSLADRAAASDAAVLFTGEPGSGKETLARYVHARSARSAEPFVVAPCSGLEPDSLADRYLAAAGSGALFLDGVPELPEPAQARLVSLLRDGCSARVLAAAPDAEGAGLRADLFYRLNVLSIAVPPLRGRPEDVPDLARSFLARADRPGLALSTAALDRLARHAWPGNVRELECVVQRAALLAEDDEVRPEHLRLPPPAPSRPREEAPPPPLSLREVEEAHIRRVLSDAEGNRTRAARLLGVNRATLYAKLRRYGIEG